MVTRMVVFVLITTWFGATAVAQTGVDDRPVPKGRVLALTGECAGHGNGYVYYKIADVHYSIGEKDVLEYDLYIDPSSPILSGAVDVLLQDGGNLRDSEARDQFGLRAHPNETIKRAAGRWLHRRISLGHLAGRSTKRFELVLEGDARGVYVFYVDNIVVTREGRIVQDIFRDRVEQHEIDWYQGYDADSVACVTALAREHYPKGFIPAQPEDISAEWEALDLAGHRNARARWSPGESMAGIVYRLDVPFNFSSGAGPNYVRAAGQRIDAASVGGGNYYELHLALRTPADKPLDATCYLLGSNNRRKPVKFSVPVLQSELPSVRDDSEVELSFLAIPVACPFAVTAIELPTDERVQLFAATLRRRDDAPDDPSFRRLWMVREDPGREWSRYLRNVRFGPQFVDMPDEAEHERRLFELLVHERRSEFDELLGERLATHKSMGASLKKDRVYFVGESHIDLEWLWPWRETVTVCRDTFSQALQFMEEYPEFRFSQGMAQSYLWMKQSYPDLYDQIKRRVKTGQWEVVGGSWTEPDFNMPAGESLARQLLYGRRFFNREFGRDIKIGWAPDSFGYSRQWPQLLQAAGMNAFFTTKMLWNDTTKFPYNVFRWQAPDGSEVLACTPGQGIGSRVRPDRIKEMLDVMEERHGVRMVVIPFGVGDHGGGPSREDIETILDLQATDLAPTVRMSTIAQFLKDLRMRKDLRLPVWNDEMYLQYHRGTLTSQAKVKWFNRKGEVLLLTAERFGTLAAADGVPFARSEMDKLWQRVLFHQCHDGLPGTSVPSVKLDIADDYRWILPTGERHLADALEALSHKIDTRGPGVPVVVFNPLAWDRTGPVEIPWTGAAISDDAGAPVVTQTTEQGRETFMASIPALGYSVFHIQPGSQRPEESDEVSTIEVDEWTIRNEHLQFTIDPATGNLNSVKLLPGGQEVLGDEGGVLELYTDRPEHWDAWNLGLSDRRIINELDSIEIVERGPVRVVVRIIRSFSSSRLTQDVVLYAGQRWIEFRTKVDWYEDHKLLRAAFALAHTSPKATFHIPYGTIERSADPQTDEELAMFEVAAIFWADQGDGNVGAALLNDCKYGYSASRQWLRLSLLKAATWPDPQQDQGHHEFTYAFHPHQGDWRAAGIMHAGYELNYPLRLQEATNHAGLRGARHSFLNVAMLSDRGAAVDGAESGIILTTLKPAEDGNGWIIRLHEIFGRKGTVRLTFDRDVAGAERVDLLERRTGGVPIEGKSVRLAIGPHRIETLRVRLGG